MLNNFYWDSRLKTTPYLSLLMLVFLLVTSSDIQAKIARVLFAPDEPAKCMEAGIPAIVQGSKRRLRIEGSWTDWTKLVIASGGITGKKIHSNAAPSWVELELEAAPDAVPGSHEIMLDYPISNDIFSVVVLESQRVYSVRVLNPPEQNFRFLNLAISGQRLETSLVPEVELVSYAGEKSFLASGIPGGRIIQSRFIQDSHTGGRVELEFFKPMQQAVISLRLHSQNLPRSCRPLNFRIIRPIVVRTKTSPD